MMRALSRLLKKWFTKRPKSKASATAAPPRETTATVSEEDVRKRLEGLGYIE